MPPQQQLWRLCSATLFVFVLLHGVARRAPADEEKPLPPAAAKGAVDYTRDVQPLLTRSCLGCHGPKKQESSFRVDDRSALLAGGDYGEPGVLPGNSAKSHLILAVAGVDEDLVMPPEGEGKRLTAEEIGILRAWIDQGAKMPAISDDLAELSTDHWSFQPVKRPDPPQLDDSFVANPIDAFILSRLKNEGLAPSSQADRATLIRRLYLDMLGLLPTPEQVQQFESDQSPQAYENLVERVLASPHYGERWARHWLDVVRFAESNGFETNYERPNAWRYRDWVIAAFNDDIPYDRFVAAQLAGDATGQDVATGFLVGGAYDSVKSPDPALTLMQRQDELADMVNTTGTAFLGLTLGCARCHNHKFDPLLQKDYYSLQAVFAGVGHGERAIRSATGEKEQRELKQVAIRLKELQEKLAGFNLLPPPNARINEEHFPAAEACFVRFTVAATNSVEPCIDELEIWTAEEKPRNVALAAAGAKATSSGNYAGDPKHRLEHVNDGRYGNEWSWISNTQGAGWVQIELSEPVKINRIVWGRDRNEKYNDRLATKYRIEVAREADQWQPVAGHERRLPFGMEAAQAIASGNFLPSKEDAAAALKVLTEIETLNERRKLLSQTAKAYAGVFSQPPPTHRLYRGDPMAKRELVAPEALTVLHDPVGSLELATDAPEQRRRVELAQWITSPENPLTARVMVNRLWHYHFGRGIVATPSDFGAMGFKPTHPELLDWLASELVANGWSLKHIHRLILNSSTYRQATAPSEQSLAKDKDSALLWRYPPRRLEAEAIRDNILLVSGALDKRMGGPGFLLFHPNSNYARNWIAKDDFGPGEFRRIVYALKLRMEGDAVFAAFDCPDGGQIAPRRSRSTTPIQALNLYNSNFILQQAGLFAKRVQTEAGERPEDQVKRVFELVLGRAPAKDEADDAAQLVKQHGLPALCRAMFNTSEFLFIP